MPAELSPEVVRAVRHLMKTDPAFKSRVTATMVEHSTADKAERAKAGNWEAFKKEYMAANSLSHLEPHRLFQAREAFKKSGGGTMDEPEASDE